MATISHHVEYTGALILSKLAQMLSPRMADALARHLGRFVYAVLASRRRIALDNLKTAFGDRYNDRELRQITKEVFENIGQTSFEIARQAVMTPEYIDTIVEDAGVDILKRVNAEGRGAVCVMSHFGNWELLGAWLALKGLPVTFGVGTQHNPKFDRMLNNLRRVCDVQIVQLRSSAKNVFKAIKANRIVAMVSDQHAPSGAVILNFFGRPAATPKGPALFALRTGCPILPLLLRRERYDKHVVIAGEPVYPPDAGTEDEKVQILTEAYTGFFEDNIRKYPGQWLWTHRRWKV